MQILGAGIRIRREEIGLAQEELARLLGVKQQTISRWEKGSVTPPPKRLAALADVLNLELDPLLSRAGYLGEPDPTARPFVPLLTNMDLSEAAEDDLFLVIDLAWEQLKLRRRAQSPTHQESS